MTDRSTIIHIKAFCLNPSGINIVCFVGKSISIFNDCCTTLIRKRTTRTKSGRAVQINHVYFETAKRQQTTDSRQQDIIQSKSVNKQQNCCLPLCVKSIIKCQRFGGLMRKLDEFWKTENRVGSSKKVNNSLPIKQHNKAVSGPRHKRCSSNILH